MGYEVITRYCAEWRGAYGEDEHRVLVETIAEATKTLNREAKNCLNCTTKFRVGYGQ